MLLVQCSVFSSVLSVVNTFLYSRGSLVGRCLALSKYTLSQGAAVRSDDYLALETAVDLRHVVGSRLVVLILDDEDGVRHEPGDVHAEVLEVPLRFLVQDPVGADYYWQGALPVGINLTFIIGIEGPRLHHANVNRLVAVGQEDVRLLVLVVEVAVCLTSSSALSSLDRRRQTRTIVSCLAVLVCAVSGSSVAVQGPGHASPSPPLLSVAGRASGDSASPLSGNWCVRVRRRLRCVCFSRRAGPSTDRSTGSRAPVLT